MDDNTFVSSSSFIHLNREELLLQTVFLAEKLRYLEHTLACLNNDKCFLLKECEVLRANELRMINTCNKLLTPESNSDSAVLRTEKNPVERQISLDNISVESDVPVADTDAYVVLQVEDPNLREIFDIIIDFKKKNKKFPSKSVFFEKGITRYYLNKYGNVRGIKKLYYENCKTL